MMMIPSKWRMAAAGLVWAALLAAPAARAWQMKTGPLMTDWAQLVDHKAPLPEYPRPQLVRTEWLNLNGIWQFQAGAIHDPVPSKQTLTGEILVPYPMESALSGVAAYHERAWYRRSFTVPANWSGRRILLHLGAVDWESEVFINGRSAGVHRGGYDAASYDVTPYLSGDGPQELIVRVYDPTNAAGKPRGKQTLSPSGIMYTSNSGIWQTVWLEPVPDTSVASLQLVPDIDHERLAVTVHVTGPAAGITVKAVARSGATVVGSISGAPGNGLLLPIPNPHLWNPDDPYLYDLEITLSKGETAVDAVSSYFGMRKISLGDSSGFKKMLLNNEFVFQFGPLDQGYWPDGIYTAPTDEALRSDIEQARLLGFNMIRKHLKVEPARWYYWADKLGMLVWQDMPSVNSYGGSQPIDVPQYKSELAAMVSTRWNSPAIVMWVVFNEAQGQHDTEALVAFVRTLDPSRLVNQASGGKDCGVGDVLDGHNYPDPVCPGSSSQAVVCGEFGGIGLNTTGHMWKGDGFGYAMVANGDELTTRFEGFCTQLAGMAGKKGLSGAVYTEITDVETEANGFLTYDRKVRKPDADRIRAAIAAVNTSVQSTTTRLRPVVSRPAVPATPAGLHGAYGVRGMALGWHSSPGATSYVVKRSPLSGGPYTRIVPRPPVNSFCDPEVKLGASYHYVVSAVNAAGESPNSTELGLPTVTAFRVSGFPGQQQPGVPALVRVAATDANGATVPDYAGAIRLSSSDESAVLPGNYRFVSADAGVKTFAVTLKQPGTQSITATDSVVSTLTGTQSGILVTRKPAIFFFATAGTATWTAPPGVTAVELLVIGGGGGAGGLAATDKGAAGGGGAGGLIYYGAETPAVASSYSVTPGQTYAITVGAGGIAHGRGGNSSFDTVTAVGGGYGGQRFGEAGGAGGSGGGASVLGWGPIANGAAGTPSQGHAGGGSSCTTGRSHATGGGGGGAGTAGTTGTPAQAGHGGDGLSYSITGTAVTYAGGGGGSQIEDSLDGRGGAGYLNPGGGGMASDSGGGQTGLVIVKPVTARPAWSPER